MIDESPFKDSCCDYGDEQQNYTEFFEWSLSYTEKSTHKKLGFSDLTLVEFG